MKTTVFRTRPRLLIAAILILLLGTVMVLTLGGACWETGSVGRSSLAYHACVRWHEDIAQVPLTGLVGEPTYSVQGTDGTWATNTASFRSEAALEEIEDELVRFFRSRGFTTALVGDRAPPLATYKWYGRENSKIGFRLERRQGGLVDVTVIQFL